MGWARRRVAAHRLLLLAGVVAVVMSLLTMHQLSLNHTAADPTYTGVHVSALSSRSLDGHDPAAIDEDHTHLVSLVVDGHPGPDSGACLGCSGHQAMALTCLAALILLAVGWVLRRPAEWRGVRIPCVVPLRLRPNRAWLRRPFTPVELSVSRT